MGLLAYGDTGWGDELFFATLMTIAVATTAIFIGFFLAAIFASFKLSKNKVKIKDLKKKRDSNIVWFNDRWVYREIQPYVHQANKNAGWNFDWERSESCQFTKYKLNQYYDWHCDSSDKPYVRKSTNDPEHGKIRKLSMTCQLTDGSEYEGGELEFMSKGKTAKLEQGQAMFFASWLQHRVKPVIRGERSSLVMWFGGPSFK